METVPKIRSISNLISFLFCTALLISVWIGTCLNMGVVCTSYYSPTDADLVSLSSKRYKEFPLKTRKSKGEVVMQLTGEGLSANTSMLHANELVSVRFHYQYPCTFAPRDDSVLIYGESNLSFNNFWVWLFRPLIEKNWNRLPKQFVLGLTLQHWL